MGKRTFCLYILESPFESVLLIADSELISALWLWPGTMSRKALPPPFGIRINPIQDIRLVCVAFGGNNRKHSSE